jgi:hypothetical protein
LHGVRRRQFGVQVAGLRDLAKSADEMVGNGFPEECGGIGGWIGEVSAEGDEGGWFGFGE